MALWQLLNLGTGCTVIYIYIRVVFPDGKSAQYRSEVEQYLFIYPLFSKISQLYRYTVFHAIYKALERVENLPKERIKSKIFVL